ncbi:MAG TPA: DUF4238 domain-containing protein, partial [Anaerolineales bacterium]|nr:DUF4238 domain-containing protein [Anaerolineales bacterium]
EPLGGSFGSGGYCRQMGDHYIPRYYLKGFGPPGQPNVITRVEKYTTSTLTTDVKNVAQENDFYSEEIEIYLSTEIERPANDVLAKLRQLVLPGVAEKVSLARYLTALLKRVPRAKERYDEMSPEILERVFSDLERQIDEIAAERPEKSDLMRARREQLAQLRVQYETGMPKEMLRDIWLNNLRAERSMATEERLTAMTWTYLMAREGAEFITCDNPVFFHTAIGIGNMRSEVTFPISSQLALWATWSKTLPENFVRVRKSVVKLVNRRTASCATRYLFSSGTYDWVVSLAQTSSNYRHKSIIL